MQPIGGGKTVSANPRHPAPSLKSCSHPCAAGALPGEKFHREPQHTPPSSTLPIRTGAAARKGEKSGNKVGIGEEVRGKEEVVGMDPEWQRQT